MAEAPRETGTYGPFLAQPSVDAALVSLASTQHGVFDLGQLHDLGLNASAARKRAAAGRLHRLYRGVYSLVPRELLTREGHWMAAVLACGPGAALSHRSAAALLNLRPFGGTRIDVTVPGRSSRKHPGIAVHCSLTLTPFDTTRVENIPCTTASRTLLDLGEAVNRRGLERALDQAETLEVFDLRALDDQLERNSTRLAASVLRAVLDEHYAGSTETWSHFEERFLAFARAAGLPQPAVNFWIVLSDGGLPIRADFAWPAQRVIVETDGWDTHRTRQAFERDRRKDLRLGLAGWRPMRVTSRQLDAEPALVEATSRALLGL